MIFRQFEDVPRRRYRVVYADPAWRFAVRSSKGEGRSPDAHYQTMTLAEIKALPVAEVAAPDSFCFMWTTAPHLKQGLEVLAAWGFAYSTVAFTWAKTLRRYNAAPGLFYDATADFHTGLGYTTRGNAEFCLLGRRGQPKRLSKGVRSLVVSPLREHSRKPDEVRDRIIAFADGPRLEMFARSEAPGFDAWGNEVEKFTPARRRVRLPSWGRT